MKKLLVFCTIVILVGLPVLGGDHRPIRADGETPTPTMLDEDNIVMDLGNGLTLIGKASHEEFTSPNLVIDLCWPALKGETAKTVDNFNEAVDLIVQKTADRFRDKILQATPNAALSSDTPTDGSSFTLWYEIATANGSILSLIFHFTTFTPEDVSPTEYAVTLNYDLKGSIVLSLKDLFQPDADYLKVISDYSIKTLKASGKLLIPEGAQPTKENYSRWSINFKGLQINFDDGQVAPIGVGAQIVKIPFSVFKAIINPSGVLANSAKAE